MILCARRIYPVTSPPITGKELGVKCEWYCAADTAVCQANHHEDGLGPSHRLNVRFARSATTYSIPSWVEATIDEEPE